MIGLREHVERFASAEVSSRPLALVRMFVPLTIQYQFTSPWVSHRIDDVSGALLLSWVMFASAWAVFFGLKTRVSAAILAVSFAVLHFYYGFHLGDARLADPVLVLQAVVLLAITPCGRSLSTDRSLAVRRARAEGRAPPPERARRWQLELFVLHLAVIHSWAAVDMSDAAWLRGEGIERYILDYYGTSDTLQTNPWVHTLAVVAGWFGLIGCWVIALGLLVRPLRSYVLALAAVMQFCVLMLWSPTYYDSSFTLMLFALMPGCLPPERVHGFFTTVLRDPAARPAPAEVAAPAGPRRLWPMLVAFALMLAWSNIPPYRMHIGDSRKIGLFSWHWMLYQQGGARICDLRYFDMNRGGEPIERWKLLGYERPGLMPDELARIHAEDLGEDYRRVCNAMVEHGDPHPNVEVFARCGFGKGWVFKARRKANACAFLDRRKGANKRANEQRKGGR